MKKNEILHNPEFVRHFHRACANMRLAKALLKRRWEWTEEDRKRFEGYLSCKFLVTTDDLILALELLLNGEAEDSFEILKVRERERRILETLATENEEAEIDFALLTFEDDNLTNEVLELLQFDLWDSHKIPEYRELISSFNRAEQSELFSRTAYLHTYVRRALFDIPAHPVIIDGSNVIYEATGFVNINRLDRVFDFLASLKQFFFPYRIVFDANIRYIVSSQQRKTLESWLSSPWVEEHSPADERIIELAKRMKAVILSNDSFSEYDTSGLKFLKFGGRKRC